MKYDRWSHKSISFPSKPIELLECLPPVLISPFLPDTAQSIFDKLSLGQIPDDFDSLKNFGELKQDTIVTKGQNLFERIKVEDELKKLDELFPHTPQSPKEDPLGLHELRC